MQTTGIREDDLVEYDVRGQRGVAKVKTALHHDPVLKKKVITLAPLSVRDHLPAHNVTSRQIREHWRKRRTKGTNGNGNGE